ncbi:MAG TPA: HK97 family phage prohead protease [Candidatus Dormibacteraeota bacterium]|nr:HK97 family phage prohead protease [Candidatus Dormibacteraeota bacterium]
MTKLERRALTTDVTAKGDGMTFEGIPIRTNSQTYIGRAKQGFFEQVSDGAVERALKRGSDVRSLLNHNPDLLLGRTGSGTVRLEQVSDGLRNEVDLPNTSTGRDVSALVARGDIAGQSFGFEVAKDRWAPMPGGHAQLRTIEDFALVDAGPVTFPAYGDTVAAVRSADVLVGLARENRDVSDGGVTDMVAALDAALDAAIAAVSSGNVPQAAALLTAAAVMVDQVRYGLMDINTDLLMSLGLPDIPAMLDVADTAIDAVMTAAKTGSVDPAALSAAELAVDALMVAMRIPDADEPGGVDPAVDTSGQDALRTAQLSIHRGRLSLLRPTP